MSKHFINISYNLRRSQGEKSGSGSILRGSDWAGLLFKDQQLEGQPARELERSGRKEKLFEKSTKGWERSSRRKKTSRSLRKVRKTDKCLANWKMFKIIVCLRFQTPLACWMNRASLISRRQNSTTLTKMSKKKYTNSNWRYMRMKREGSEKSFMGLTRRRSSTCRSLRECATRNARNTAASIRRASTPFWRIGISFWAY